MNSRHLLLFCNFCLPLSQASIFICLKTDSYLVRGEILLWVQIDSNVKILSRWVPHRLLWPVSSRWGYCLYPLFFRILSPRWRSHSTTDGRWMWVQWSHWWTKAFMFNVLALFTLFAETSISTVNYRNSSTRDVCDHCVGSKMVVSRLSRRQANSFVVEGIH